MIMFGFHGIAAWLYGLLDPVGALGANDADPYGMPPSAAVAVMWIIGYAALIALGVYMMRRRSRVNHPQAVDEPAFGAVITSR